MKNIITLLLLINSISLNAQVNNTQDIQGVWEEEGYGRIIEVKKQKTYLYNICKIDCSAPDVIPNKALLNEFKIHKTSDSTIVVQNGVSNYFLNKIENLPKLCSAKKDKKDPLYNFDVLWQTFEENYCYFEERKIDWDALKTKYRSQITAATTSFELFLILDNMLTGLNDGHTGMSVPRNLEKKYLLRKEAKRQIRREIIRDSLGRDYKLPGINVDSTRLKVIGNYVSNVKTYNFGVLNYGLINNDVAMVQINGMEQYANYNIPNDISEAKAEKLYDRYANKSENYTQDNVDGTSDIIDKIISEIKDTKACIIDVRFNGGGYDEVQLEILKRFATKDTVVVYKKAKKGDGFTNKTPFKVTPSVNAYTGKVFFLTSHITASAAEDFLLCAMAARPDAIRIGSNTEGIFSDVLGKKLPNGWEFSLSNEIYESPDGISYEAIGIPPHHKIEYHKKGYWFFKDFSENTSGKDAAVEKVFELLKIETQ